LRKPAKIKDDLPSRNFSRIRTLVPIFSGPAVHKNPLSYPTIGLSISGGSLVLLPDGAGLPAPANGAIPTPVGPAAGE